MKKSEVITILKDDNLTNRMKYSLLLIALSQAPVKNLGLTAHYNRAGYSDKNIKSIEYDVKKVFSITPASLKDLQAPATIKQSIDQLQPAADSPEPVVQDKPDVLDLDKLNADLSEINLQEADYYKIKSLAFAFAKELDLKFKNKSKATLLSFLESQKKSLAPEA